MFICLFSNIIFVKDQHFYVFSILLNQNLFFDETKNILRKPYKEEILCNDNYRNNTVFGKGIAHKKFNIYVKE